MCCASWYQSLFGVCLILRTHANPCSCFFLPPCRFYPFVWVSMVFKRVCQISNVRMQSNGLGVYTRSNVTTFECCFLISKYHENCNAVSSFTVLHNVPLCHETLSFPLQLNVFISSLCFLFIVYYLFKKHWHIHVSVWVVKMGLTALGVLLTHT